MSRTTTTMYMGSGPPKQGGEQREGVGMAGDYVRLAPTFLHRSELDLASAVPGSFVLNPHDQMLADLRRDYGAMPGMVFGPVPTVDEVVTRIRILEQRISKGELIHVA